ncbi:hypothetical protein [Nitrospira sp. Kam-Ns4a]
MTRSGRLAAIGLMTLMLAGCGSLMHPKAGEFLAQARGASGVETAINLTTMIERTIAELQGKSDYEAGLDRLHNQLYALKKAGCQVTERQAKTVAYAKAVTLRREVGTVFHRLWKNREDQALRDMHLELLAKRVQELRDALQGVKG